MSNDIVKNSKMSEEVERINAEKRKLDYKIDDELKYKSLLQQLQGEFEMISKNLTECVELFSLSAQGASADEFYDEISMTNTKTYKNALLNFEKDIININKKVDEYNKEKDDLDKKKDN